MKEPESAIRRLQLVISLGFVKDPKQRCLLIRRNEPGHPEIHGRWELPGGKVEFGEPPAITAEREVLEETGVSVAAHRMLTLPFTVVRRLDQLEINPIILCFECRLLRLPADKFPYPSKIAEVIWAPIAEIQQLDLQDGTRFFVQHALTTSSG